MEITIIGTNYVGLVTGACFAETGISVTCVDIDSDRIEMLNKGRLPFYEPGLKRMLERNIEKGRLEFSTDLSNSIQQNDAIIIASNAAHKPLPQDHPMQTLKIAKTIGKSLSHYTIVITQCTNNIGTTHEVKLEIQKQLQRRKMNIEFDIASVPEFLKKGEAINDFRKPERIVIGTETNRPLAKLKKLYKPFLRNGHPLLFTDIVSAEMIKYTASAMLATKISFINDIARLCEIIGADIEAVRKGIGSDPRIGNEFIFPGVGYGGSSLPHDVQVLIHTAQEKNCDLKLLKAVERINLRQKKVIFDKIMNHFDSNIKDKVFALWGLSFKPQTDDTEEAPALTLIQNLLNAGAKVQAYDPAAMNKAKDIFGDSISYAKDMYSAVIDAEALILLTEWSEFRIPNLDILERLMTNHVVFDGRNILDYNEMAEYGFTYYSIGREKISAGQPMPIPG